MTHSQEQGPAAGRKLNSLIGVIPVALFSILHLWTNWRAMQGRQAFEAQVVPLLRSGAFGLLLLLVVYVPFAISGALDFRRWKGESNPSASRKLEVFTGVASLLFILATGYLYPLRIALGRIDAFDVHPELCAELSATTSQGIPLKAVLALVGFAAVSHQLATSLRECLDAFRWPRSPVAAERARIAVPWIGIVAFALFANGVLYFATGAPLF